MAEKIKIGNEELIILLKIDDSEYKQLTVCLNGKGEKVFISDNRIIKEKSIIDKINMKYHFKSSENIGDAIIME